MTTSATGGGIHGKFSIPLKIKCGRKRTFASVDTDSTFEQFEDKIRQLFPECGSKRVCVKFRDSKEDVIIVEGNEAFLGALFEWHHFTQTGERFPIEGMRNSALYRR